MANGFQDVVDSIQWLPEVLPPMAKSDLVGLLRKAYELGVIDGTLEQQKAIKEQFDLK